MINHTYGTTSTRSCFHTFNQGVACRVPTKVPTLPDLVTAPIHVTHTDDSKHLLREVLFSSVRFYCASSVQANVYP